MPTKGILAAVTAKATETTGLVKLLAGPVSRVNREAAVQMLKARAMRGEVR